MFESFEHSIPILNVVFYPILILVLHSYCNNQVYLCPTTIKNLNFKTMYILFIPLTPANKIMTGESSLKPLTFPPNLVNLDVPF